MRILSEILSGFLLSAVWQVAAVTTLVYLCDLLLQLAAVRYRHLLWVAALLLSLTLPVVTGAVPAAARFINMTTPVQTSIEKPIGPLPTTGVVGTVDAAPTTAKTWSAFRINAVTALMLALSYLLFCGYRAGMLLRAWNRTLTIRRGTVPIDRDDRLDQIITECEEKLGISGSRILSSLSISVPITIGFWKPIVVLPEDLLHQSDRELLLAAIGHEFIHITRRDYLFNLIYELLFLPLAFHPAAILVRRRIKETRELCCDQTVADKLLNAEVYARSLVQLASSAPSLRPLAVTVGIADADILEVRIMSLLRKSKVPQRTKLFLVALALLLGLPSLVAASFAVRFEVAPQGTEQQESTAEREKRAAQEREKVQRSEFETQDSGLLLRRRNLELEMRAKAQAELARHAKISMDQAIQVATSQYPGTVMECNLVAERWQGPGVLAEGAQVFYHVVILTGDGSDGPLHVFVSALDGRLVETEKEKRREAGVEVLRMRNSEGGAPISVGVVNGKAISLPQPVYPAIARQARVSGSVEVEVEIDEEGNVISAHAVSGHPLLQSSAVDASRLAKFAPTLLEGRPIRVQGTLVYSFVAN